MTHKEFRELIGQDVVVDYSFFDEIQQWSMMNFYTDKDGEIHHNRFPINIHVFISLARNPHKGKATHG